MSIEYSEEAKKQEIKDFIDTHIDEIKEYAEEDRNIKIDLHNGNCHSNEKCIAGNIHATLEITDNYVISLEKDGIYKWVHMFPYKIIGFKE